MNYTIFDLSGMRGWKRHYDALPEPMQDVYFMPEYYEVQERHGKGTAQCFVIENEKGMLLYPFLLNSIVPLGFDLADEYCDIEGAYGFNGAISNAQDTDLLKSFHELFSEYAGYKGIIAEFTRFNPVLRNHSISSHLDIVFANQNISLNLDHDNFWFDDYEHATRKNINKAIRNGLTVSFFHGDEVIDEWLDHFYSIYIDTMVRNKAEQFYFFDRSYFDMLIKNMKNNVLLFFTMKEGTPVSTELVLYNTNIAYSYLGGTISEYFPFRPNDILKHSIILRLKDHGVKRYCLGGGIKPGDSLFKYKRSFAKNGIIDFFIGKKIYREDIYNKLVGKWEMLNPDKKDVYKNFLLKYRI